MWWRWMQWLLWIKVPGGKYMFLRWLAGLVMLTVDLTSFGLWYMTFMDLMKRHSRPIREDEKQKANSVFGASIPWHLLSFDGHSIPATRGIVRAYVSLYTINYDGVLQDPDLIHELVHVWQYRQMGSVYITEALFAQKWGSGYNYGGAEALEKHFKDTGIRAFNPEQQADLIEDYYRWKINLPLKWAVPTPETIRLLEGYARQL